MEQYDNLLIRDQDHVGIYKGSGTGLIFPKSAFKAFNRLQDKLEGGEDVSTYYDITQFLKNKRQKAGFSIEKIAALAGLTEDIIMDIENPKTSSNIHFIAKVCYILGLDPILIGFDIGDINNELIMHTICNALLKVGIPQPIINTQFVQIGITFVIKNAMQKYDEHITYSIICNKSNNPPDNEDKVRVRITWMYHNDPFQKLEEIYLDLSTRQDKLRISPIYEEI